MSTKTQNNTLEKVPSESMHEKAKRELGVMEELLANSALDLVPCKTDELLDSVSDQRKSEGISHEIGVIAMWELKAGDPVTAYVGFPDIQRRIIEEDYFREHGLDTDELDPDAPIFKIPVTHE